MPQHPEYIYKETRNKNIPTIEYLFDNYVLDDKLINIYYVPHWLQQYEIKN